MSQRTIIEIFFKGTQVFSQAKPSKTTSVWMKYQPPTNVINSLLYIGYFF